MTLDNIAAMPIFYRFTGPFAPVIDPHFDKD
jgi:hypothetical protein